MTQSQSRRGIYCLTDRASNALSTSASCCPGKQDIAEVVADQEIEAIQLRQLRRQAQIPPGGLQALHQIAGARKRNTECLLYTDTGYSLNAIRSWGRYSGVINPVMELRHLRSFVAVAKEAHFGRAARALNVVQPAVSRTIRALEQELGVVLFERLPRGVRLTDAGRLYLREVERILANVSAASRLAREAADVGHEVTTVGYSMVLKSQEDILGNILERFSKTHPKYIVNLRFLSTFEQQKGIRERTVDVGFGHLCGAPMEGLRIVRIEEDPFCAARVGVGHRSAGLKRLSLSDLKDDPLLIFRRARNPEMFDYVMEHLQASGFKGEIIQNADFSFWNWKVELMSRNTAWILSNRSSLKAAMAGTVCLPLGNFKLSFGIDFICREDDDSKPVKALLSIIGASQRKSG